MTSRGRFAPSPTGRLHLGNARTALLGWLWAKRAGGEFLLRIEDLDPDRSRQSHLDGQLEDLSWLGLEFDGPRWRQSERRALYDAAVERLLLEGRAYPCWCSRAEVARAVSAPHVGEDGPLYPGTCRTNPTPKPNRTPAIRFKAPDEVVTFRDELHGLVTQNVAREVGDFVIRRFDGVASYQLAVVVDDAASGITQVLRGDDLLGSTARQIQLQRALGLPTPAYAHVPLLRAADGQRLAKREGASTVAGQRAAGVLPERLVASLLESVGLGDGRPRPLRELPLQAAHFDLARLRAPGSDGPF